MRIAFLKHLNQQLVKHFGDGRSPGRRVVLFEDFIKDPAAEARLTLTLSAYHGCLLATHSCRGHSCPHVCHTQLLCLSCRVSWTPCVCLRARRCSGV